MNNQSSNQGSSVVFIGLGVLLIVLGALFLVSQAVGFDLGRLGWPFFVIIPGLALSGVGLATDDPTGERITPLGAAVTMIGGDPALPEQRGPLRELGLRLGAGLSYLDRAGADHLGSLKGSKEMVVSGGRSALIGAVLFLVGAFFFKLVVGVSELRFGLGHFGWPLRLLIVGVLLLVGGLLYRRR